MSGLETRPGPLAGMRVIEIGQQIAGSFCRQLLGDMGAEGSRSRRLAPGGPMHAWGSPTLKPRRCIMMALFEVRAEKATRAPKPQLATQASDRDKQR